MERDDLTPALVAAGAWLGFGAALDVILVHEGHRPITHALRTPMGSVFLAVLCLHVADVLGPVDPFRRVAGCIPRRSRTTRHFVTNGMVTPVATAASPCPQPRVCP
jgi:hypothetical protein